MEEYIVSALKYRPLTFDSVVGQRSLTTTLKNAIATGKLAHAYLFCGPRGVGKTTCARIFAKAINCLNPQDGGDACGCCESCLAFDQQRSMNIHELDAASNNSVEDIRELCKQVLIPPQTGRYKVFIIDEVHMLSSAAFNAFLKTLEEPPSYVIFILATTEKHKILPTILSRCQVYDFQRMSTQNTIEHLQYVAQKEGYTADIEALGLIAEKADGGMRDALSIFDQMVSFSGGNLTYESVCQNLNVLSTEYYFQLVDQFLAGNVQQSLLLFNTILQKGFDGGNFIGGLASHLRNLLVARDAVTIPLLEMSDKMRQHYQEQAARCEVRQIYRMLKLCNDCDQNYRNGRNKRLQVELCLIQCCQAATDSPDACGPGPAKSLNPVFSQVTAKSESAAPTPQSAAPASVSVQPIPTAAPQPATPAPAVQVTSPAPQQAPVQQAPAASSPTPLRKVSFKHFGKQDNGVSTQVQTSATKVVQPITEDGLSAAWHGYINSLPQENAVMAQRLKTLDLSVKDTSTAVVKVSNPQMQQTIETLLGQMFPFMRQQLKNDDFHLEIVLEEMKEMEKAYSPTEILKQMQESRPPVADLVKGLQLVYD